MRKLMLAVIALATAGGGAITTSAPAAADDYPWCLSGWQTGYPGECYYTSYAQCMASAWGRVAYCRINPRVAFGVEAPIGGGRRALYPNGYYR